MTSVKKVIFRVAAVFFGICLIIFILEVGLRLWGPRYYRYNNNRDEYYSNPRGYHDLIGKDGGKNIYGLKEAYDSRGYRLPETLSDTILPVNRIDQDNVTENIILGLGDSFTYGSGVRYPDLYLVRLEEKLNTSGYYTRIKNAARVGDDLRHTMRVYSFEALKRKYELVIYGFVLNDFGLPGIERIRGFEFIDFNDPEKPYDPLRKKIRLYNFIAHLFEKKRLHEITARVYLDAFKGDYADIRLRMLKELDQAISKKGGKLIIVMFPMLYDFKKYPFQEIHDKMNGFCEDEGILMLDLLPVFSLYKDDQLWVNPTDHHPNELAHKLAAEKIYTFLTENDLVRK